MALLSIGAFFALKSRDFLGLPFPVQQALASPDSVTMIYVDPNTGPNDKRKKAGGRVILRVAQLPKGKEGAGVDWLKSLMPKDGSSERAGCFFPRHVLRVRKGSRAYDFLVCLSCGGGEIYEGEKRIGHLNTVMGGALPEKTMPFLPGHPQKEL